MVKQICISCGSELIRIDDLVIFSSFVKTMTKIYQCEACGARSPMSYCYLCGKFCSMGGRVGIYSHMTQLHSHEEGLYSLSREKLFGTVDYLASDDWFYVENFLDINPQFNLLSCDNTKQMKKFLDYVSDVDISYFGKLNDVLESINEYLIWGKETIKLSYDCRFCGEPYDTIPTLKVARKHVGVCGGVKRPNKKNG